MHESDEMLPESLRREMRREPRMGAVARARVMSAVRREAQRPQRAGWLLPSVGGALAAGLAMTMIGTALFRSPRAEDGVPARGAAVTALGTSLKDTLLLVRFALSAPKAATVMLVGDFNGWRAGATPLARTRGKSEWTADVAVARNGSRYAYVVDDTQWVADGAAPKVRAPNGRMASQLVLAAPH